LKWTMGSGRILFSVSPPCGFSLYFFFDYIPRFPFSPTPSVLSLQHPINQIVIPCQPPSPFSQLFTKHLFPLVNLIPIDEQSVLLRTAFSIFPSPKTASIDRLHLEYFSRVTTMQPLPTSQSLSPCVKQFLSIPPSPSLLPAPSFQARFCLLPPPNPEIPL